MYCFCSSEKSDGRRCGIWVKWWGFMGCNWEKLLVFRIL